MKKTLFTLALSMIAHALSANVIEIENRTDFRLSGWVLLTGLDAECNSQKWGESGPNEHEVALNPGKTTQISTKNCCALAIDLQGSKTEGNNKIYVKGSWGGGKAFMAPAVVTVGISAIRICGKSEKFLVTENKGILTVTNVANKK